MYVLIFIACLSYFSRCSVILIYDPKARIFDEVYTKVGLLLNIVLVDLMPLEDLLEFSVEVCFIYTD